MIPEHEEGLGSQEGAIYRLFGDKQLVLSLVCFSVIAALAVALASLVLVQGRSANLVRPPSPDTRVDVAFLPGGTIARFENGRIGALLDGPALESLVRGKFVVVHSGEAELYVRLLEAEPAKFVIGQPPEFGEKGRR